MLKLLWTQRQDIGPAGRTGCAMAFDPVRGKTVLFGGANPDRGTWEWDGQYWTQVSDMGPALRRNFGMVWDNASQRVMLFGGAAVGADPGAAPGATPAVLGDTWEWDGESWTQVDDTGPAARFAFAVASDTTRNRVVLFGGANFALGGPQALDDTWEWDGAAWTQQDETGPFARSGHHMTFDSARARTVLFSGIPIDGNGQSDTWEWSGTAWVRVSEFGPARRFGAGAGAARASCSSRRPAGPNSNQLALGMPRILAPEPPARLLHPGASSRSPELLGCGRVSLRENPEVDRGAGGIDSTIKVPLAPTLAHGRFQASLYWLVRVFTHV